MQIEFLRVASRAGGFAPSPSKKHFYEKSSVVSPN